MSFVDFKQDLQEYLSPVESLGVEIHIITKVYVTLNIKDPLDLSSRIVLSVSQASDMDSIKPKLL